MENNVIIINPVDNVAVSLVDIKKGDKIEMPDQDNFTALEDIPYSHKVAVMDISSGSNILKYGEIIGQAKENLNKGQWIHTHNIMIDEE